MNDEPDERGGGIYFVGAAADALELGARIRRAVESFGGVPALDDRTMGVLSAVHHARHFKYYFDADAARRRLMRRTNGRVG